jgi:hypothetical protein
MSREFPNRQEKGVTFAALLASSSKQLNGFFPLLKSITSPENPTRRLAVEGAGGKRENQATSLCSSGFLEAKKNTEANKRHRQPFERSCQTKIRSMLGWTRGDPR